MPSFQPRQDCAICGDAFTRTVPYPKADAHAELTLQEIALCGGCGSGTALPRPSQKTLDRFYASGAYWHQVTGPAQRAHLLSQSQMRIRAVQPYLSSAGPMVVADIGAGRGEIARALVKAGLPVRRYDYAEPDDAAAAEISSLALPFPAKRIASQDAAGTAADLVFLNHVLEHVAEPAVLLRSLTAQAPTGAVVYVETPHADWRFKQDVYPHTFFFTAAGLRRLGERLGVSTLLCESFGRWPASRWSPTGLVQRVAGRLLGTALQQGWENTVTKLDSAIWRYDVAPDGIWLRWIFRAK